MAQRGVRQPRGGRAAQLDFLAATFASASDGVAVVDATGRLVSMNDAGRRIAGHHQTRAGGALIPFPSMLSLRHLDGRAMPATATPMGRALRGLPALDPLAMLRRPDGADVVIRSSASPVRDDTGAIVGAVVVFREVTGERRTEEEQANLLSLITEANEQLMVAGVHAQQTAEIAEHRAAELQGVLDNMVEGVLVANAEGRITLVNEAAVRMLGLPSCEDAMVAIDELDKRLQTRDSGGPDHSAGCRSLSRALTGEVAIMEESTFRDPRTGSDVYVLTNSAPIRGQDGEILGAVSVARDVTELKEVDRMKDQFIAVAAHELKTPVTIMKGFAQLLLRNADGLSPQQRRGLEEISLGANRIHSIVRDLLDVALLSSTEAPFVLDQVDLVDLVGQAWDRMTFAHPAHDLRLTASGSVSVVADRARLEQVVENLLDNAVRYSPEGGPIEVEVSSSGDQAVVSVTDRGIGIPADKQAGIFQRFYRAHTDTPHDYGGMGVGLHISREIILRHGGTMDFESREGEGSTFRFILPMGGRPSGSR
jgi:two-component system, OmpR family, sensor histidine kinase VicK